MPVENYEFDVTGAANIDVIFQINYTDEVPDEEGPKVTVLDASYLGKGTAGTVYLPVTLSQALSYDLYVPYSTVDADPSATAQAGSDYTSTSSSVTIPAGETEASISVPILADNPGGSATISFVGLSHFEENTANSLEEFTADLPAGTQAGDLLIAVIQKQANGSITAAPAGWTQVLDERTTTTTNSGCHVLVYAKVMTASEPSSYTWEVGTTVSGAIAIAAYRGVNVSNVAGLQISATQNDSSSNTSLVAPSLTTVDDNAWLVCAYGLNPSTTSGTASFSTPTGMSERYDSNLTSDGTTLRAGLGFFDQTIAAAGSTGTKTSTAGNDGRSVSVSIALEPATIVAAEENEHFFVQLGTPKVTNSGGADANVVVARGVAKVAIIPDDLAGPIDPPDGSEGGGVMVGFHQFNNDITLTRAHEGHLGKNFACVRMFESDNRGSPSTQSKQLAEDHGGRLMLWSVKSDDWEATAAGDHDDWIDEVGAELQSWKVPAVIFIFYHEPHENSDQKNESTDLSEDPPRLSDEDDAAEGRTAVAYKAVYERINDHWGTAGYLKRDGNGGKILIGYCATDDWALGLNANSKAASGVDPLLPALADVDVFCHDGYNTINGTPDESFSSIWGPVVDLCETHQKPLIIGETGSKPGDEFASSLKTELGGTRDRDEWFREAAEFMKTNTNARKWLKGFCYYHSRRWMFLDDDGTEHPSGYVDQASGPDVEGKDGWIEAFTNDSYFTAAPFDPTSDTPEEPAPTPSGCGATYTGTNRTDAVPSGYGEVSGLAASKQHADVLWAIRDSGNPAALYRLKTTATSGEYTPREIPVTGATNSDWEDCFYADENGSKFIYVHDNRDGNGAGSNPKRLYKVNEPSNPDAASSASLAATYYWRFPGTASTDICANQTGVNQNCEAMFMYPVADGGDPGIIYAVQKKKSTADVYRLGTPDQLSTDSAAPTIGLNIGSIAHSCPSSFAVNVEGDRVITVSHGRHRVWKGIAGDLDSLINPSRVQQVKDVSGTGNNEEAADWFPHGSCGFQVIAENRSGTIYSNS